MKPQFRKETNYWDQKLSHYLHDPPDKALRIQGHEERSERLREILGDLPSCDSTVVKRADQIASGMDRIPLPGFSRIPSENGAVDFLKAPVLTHPTGGNRPLSLDLEIERDDLFVIRQGIGEIIQKDLDGDGGENPGICSFFKGDPEGLSPARFHYFHHALRDRLRMEDVGKLGGLWHRLPADTRIPDHSIWQHCALVSALSSCFSESSAGQASLMVFSITPVQDFISRARKLRDFWTGSLLLSWLAFEGIRSIIYDLGSDHILYPSLIGQPLVDRLLLRECGFSGFQWDAVTETDVASFPNKFVLLAPRGQEAEKASMIRSSILSQWADLGQMVLAEIEKRVKKTDASLSAQFGRQMEDFFSFHWSAVPLMDESRQDLFRDLLAPSVWERWVEFVRDSKKLRYEARGKGAFYHVTHAMAQSFLAAGKARRSDDRPPEEGIKCQIHNDLEILHYASETGKNPRPEHDPFWRDFKAGWGVERPDFKESERLSSVAMVKRIAGMVMEDREDHPLSSFFQSTFSFPSTTEIALHDWLKRVEDTRPDSLRKLSGKTLREKRQRLAQYVHEAVDPEYEDETDPTEIAAITRDDRKICADILRLMEDQGDPLTDSDKYYAILMMDGDHLGKLINGETLGATWESVMHPDLEKRMKLPEYSKGYRGFWAKYFQDRRLISPAIHAAVSEALGDFSLHVVPQIVSKYNGRLIYAGGDDVCAFFPVSTALLAAQEIAGAYEKGFVLFGKDDPPAEINGKWRPKPEKLSLLLGSGEGISVSAGILIRHHKRPLTPAIRQAAHLLKEKAKKEGGRNAVAVQLSKRSGGDRYFVCQWNEAPYKALGLAAYSIDDNLIDHFLEISREISQGKKLSSSFLYRLEDFRPGLETLALHSPGDMVEFLPRQIKAEKIEEEVLKRLAARVSALLVRQNRAGEIRVETDPLIMARFIAPLMGRYEYWKSEEKNG